MYRNKDTNLKQNINFKYNAEGKLNNYLIIYEKNKVKL